MSESREHQDLNEKTYALSFFLMISSLSLITTGIPAVILGDTHMTFFSGLELIGCGVALLSCFAIIWCDLAKFMLMLSFLCQGIVSFALAFDAAIEVGPGDMPAGTGGRGTNWEAASSGHTSLLGMVILLSLGYVLVLTSVRYFKGLRKPC